MLKIDFLVFFYIDTVGVKSPGLKDTFFKLSDTLMCKVCVRLINVHSTLYNRPLQSSVCHTVHCVPNVHYFCSQHCAVCSVLD